MVAMNGHMQWDGSVVALSIWIAFVGSYCTITLYEQFRLVSKENIPKLFSPNVILALMAFSLGVRHKVISIMQIISYFLFFCAVLYCRRCDFREWLFGRILISFIQCHITHSFVYFLIQDHALRGDAKFCAL
jgi:hypothetical protein